MFFPLFCGGFISIACKSCALQCVHLVSVLRWSATSESRVAQRFVRWAGPRCGLRFTSFSKRCVRWELSAWYASCQLMPSHHSEAHIAHGQLVPLMLARNKVSSTKVESIILLLTRGTTVAGLPASLLCGASSKGVTSFCAWW